MVETVVVVGAGLAGLRAAESARLAGFEGRLILVGSEKELPYDRPPLSKTFLTGEKSADDITLVTQAQVEEKGIELRLGCRDVGLDLPGKRLLVGCDAQPFDRLIVATGAAPRTLSEVDPDRQLLYLRSMEDGSRLGQRLAEAKRLLVIGGGLIGCEVAAVARTDYGMDVTLVEPQPGLMLRAAGPVFSELCTRLHVDQGVDVRCGVGVRWVRRVRNGGIQAELTDGSAASADIGMAGIGVIPNAAWLAGCGLTVSNGVVCDSTLTTTHPDVLAAGDVARYRDTHTGALVRHEHWTNAVQQGRHVGKQALLDPDEREPYADNGYFWSQQYGNLIQGIGDLQGEASVRERGEDGQMLGVATVDEQVVGAFAIGMARDFALMRQSVAKP